MNRHKMNHSSIPLEVEWVKEKFRFAYNPKGYSEQIYAETARLGKLNDENPEKLQMNRKILVSMLMDWDLTEGCPDDDLAHRTNGNTQFCKEHAVLINEETVADLPAILCGRMVSEIMKDMNTDGDAPKSVVTSPSGS